MRVVDRRRHGNDDEIRILQGSPVGAHRQLRRSAQVLRADLAGRIIEFTVGRNLGGRHVHADGRHLLPELDRQRQPHVAQADDGDLAVADVLHCVLSPMLKSIQTV